MKKIILTSIAFFTTGLLAQAQLKVTSSGFVRMDYTGTTMSGPALFFGLGTNGEWGIEDYDGGLNFWKPWPSQNANNYSLFIESSTSNIGLSRKPSGYKLDVNGVIRATATLVVSDKRFKENIVKLENPNRLRKLQPVSYDLLMSDDSTDTKSIQYDPVTLKPINTTTITKKKKLHQHGLVAQDVQKVFPELVHTDKEGYLSINYIGIIPFLIESYNAQQATIDSLNAVIADIQKQLPVKNDARQNMEISMVNNLPATSIKKAELYQNNPNPFNQNSSINYLLPTGVTSARIIVYDMQGTQVKAYVVAANAGKASLNITASEYKPGMYLYTLLVDNTEVDTKRMIITE